MSPTPAYPYKVAGMTAGGDEIRRFADEKIASQIDDAIASANLKADQSTAIIVKYNDAGTLRGAVMKRFESKVPTWVPFIKSKKVEWSFAGIVAHDFKTGDTSKELGLVVRL